MTREQEVFLSLLKDHVNGTVTDISFEGIDTEVLYEYGKQHSLSGVLYAEMKKHPSLPEEVRKRFQKGFFNDVYLAVNHEVFMKDLCEAFENEGLTYLPFKGWVIKDYWPVPQLRTMGDTDILIHTEDRETFDSIMRSFSYDRLIDNPAVWTYHQQDMIVEIHDHMFYEHLMSDIDYVDYFDHVWDYSKEGLDESVHFLYLITHMAKHTINHGMGFRAYMDLIFLCRGARERLRWDWIEEELEKLKLLQFTKTCFAFCRAWFDFKMPLPAEELDEGFYTFVTEKLFQDGIFGLENEQNEAAHSAKEIAHAEAPYYAGALKLTLHRLFPPYEEMRIVPWYSFVDEKPWLMPAAWVYRWGYCLVHKKELSRKLISEPFAKKDVIEKRQKLIHDWGL